MKIRAGATTDTGRVRECNEDAYARVDRRGLFVVCDGMGGEAAGEVASRLAVDTVSRELTDVGRRRLSRASFWPARPSWPRRCARRIG